MGTRIFLGEDFNLDGVRVHLRSLLLEITLGVLQNTDGQHMQTKGILGRRFFLFYFLDVL